VTFDRGFGVGVAIFMKYQTLFCIIIATWLFSHENSQVRNKSRPNIIIVGVDEQVHM
jgi:hypothetical protein